MESSITNTPPFQYAVEEAEMAVNAGKFAIADKVIKQEHSLGAWFKAKLKFPKCKTAADWEQAYPEIKRLVENTVKNVSNEHFRIQQRVRARAGTRPAKAAIVSTTATTAIVSSKQAEDESTTMSANRAENSGTINRNSGNTHLAQFKVDDDVVQRYCVVQQKSVDALQSKF
jgi:hypothetical protein